MKCGVTARGCARALEAAVLLPTPTRPFSSNIKTSPPRISLLSPLRQTPRLIPQNLDRNRQHYATHAPASVQEDVVHQDYPHAPPGVFANPADIDEWKALLLSSRAPKWRLRKTGNAYSCSFEVHITDDRKYETEKVAQSKKDAILAASRDMLLKLHNNGVLRERFSDLQPMEVEGEVPTQDDYPEAPPDFFEKPEEMEGWHALFPSRRVSRRVKKIGEVSTCTFSVEVSEAMKFEAIARALSFHDAVVAASRAMLARLHNNGILREHLHELPHTNDLEHPVARTEITRWHEDYPEAPAELFQSPEVLKIWQKMLPKSKHFHSRATKRVSYGRWRCFFKIWISQDTTYETTKYSTTKENANLVAAQDILRRLHHDGALKTVFKPPQHTQDPRKDKGQHPSPINTNPQVISDEEQLIEDSRPGLGDLGRRLLQQSPSAKAKSKLDSYIDQMIMSPSVTNLEDDGPPFETSAAGQETKSTLDVSYTHADAATFPPLSQDDPQHYAVRFNARAMSDVYNYCATILTTPHFEIHRPTRRKFTVTIRLPERDIQVEASGSFEQAVLNASLEFKAAVESYHLEHDDNPISMMGDSTLNIDNAKPFVRFHNTYYSEAQITFDTDPVEHIPGMPSDMFRVQAKLNEENLDQAVIARQANASNLAYLIAAVHLVKKEPELFDQFIEMEKSSLGHVLGSVRPIPLSVTPENLSSMSSASSQILQKMKANDEPISDEQESIMRNFRSRRVLSSDAAKKRNWVLKDSYEAFQTDDSQAALRYLKSTFPMNRYRDQVLDLVNQNVYSIVIGATGSGKTTQVPQIILEDAIRRGDGSKVNVICTQPRRIAATSVANRVAAERNEKLQKTVGYHIRHDSKLPNDDGSITYCTTGILLKLLQHRPDELMDRLSHIIIDEVHERNRLIDFLMIMVKKAVESRRQAGRRIPRIVLMSATLETELFANYFAQIREGGAKLLCPSLTVPGRNFGVKESYLEDILAELGAAYHSSELNLLRNHPPTQEYLDIEKSLIADSRSAIVDWTRQPDTEKEASLVPAGLVATIVAHIVKKGSNGAILAFLPGLGEIREVEKLLRTTSPLGYDFNDGAKFKICLLHGLMEDSQDAVFDPVPDGCRKIILSTNVAETSITIPDVQSVVDSGKHREHWYDQQSRITKLQSSWISKTNLKQRSGRAGRVQNGSYYALFSKARRDTFRAAGLPEILRSDLQDICLDIKAQSFRTPIKDFLAAAIEPPLPKMVESSIQNLKALEAITEDEKLTPLGRLLASLPVHPELGKLIVLGIIFRCFDSLLIIGAAAQERPLFLRPLAERAAADKARNEFGQGTKSDPVTLINAFREARRLSRENGPGYLNDMHKDFLSARTFNSIDRKMNEIENALVEAGLIPYNAPGHRQEFRYGHPSINRNSDSLPLLKALTFAGYRGNLAIRMNPFLCRTRKDTPIFHPSSLNYIRKTSRKQKEEVFLKSASSVYSYHRMDKSTDGAATFLRDSSEGTALMAAIFGCEVQPDRGNLIVDKWLPLNVKSEMFDDRPHEIILKFRKALDLMLSDAFSSLAKQGDKSAYLADDSLREEFAATLATVLEEEDKVEEISDELLGEMDSMVDADYREALRASKIAND